MTKLDTFIHSTDVFLSFSMVWIKFCCKKADREVFRYWQTARAVRTAKESGQLFTQDQKNTQLLEEAFLPGQLQQKCFLALKSSSHVLGEYSACSNYSLSWCARSLNQQTTKPTPEVFLVRIRLHGLSLGWNPFGTRTNCSKFIFMFLTLIVAKTFPKIHKKLFSPVLKIHSFRFSFDFF